MNIFGAQNQPQNFNRFSVKVFPMLRAFQRVSFTSDLSSSLDSGEDELFEACVVWSTAETAETAVTA